MSFTGFGKFSTAHRAAREGVNPRNPARRCRSRRHACRSSRPAARSRAPSRAAERRLLGNRPSSRKSRGPPRRGPFSGLPRTYVRLASGDAASRSTPPTGSSSSSRSAAARLPPRRRRGICSRSATCRSGLARTLLAGGRRRATPGSPGAATRSALAAPAAPGSRSSARSFVVVDLETTGLDARAAAGSARSAPCASTSWSAPARSRRSSRPAGRLPAAVAALTGLTDARAAPRAAGPGRRSAASWPSRATPCSSPTTRASTSRSSTARSSASRAAGSAAPGRRHGPARAPPARAAGAARLGLAALSQFFGTAARPCHRALPDAEATAEILLQP